MRHPHGPCSPSHQALVFDELLAGMHFIRQARRGLEARVKPYCDYQPHPAVPYPFTLVVCMQQAHQVSLGVADDEVDLAQSTSIQYALTWNRVIGMVSGRLAAAYRRRALPAGVRFSRIAEAPCQTYYFAHRVRVAGLQVHGYWVGRDLHAGTGEPMLVIQPVALDPVTGCRCRGQVPAFLAIPLRERWDDAVEAAACDTARAFSARQARSVVSRTRQMLGAWQPIVALVYDALTGRGGAAYEQAAAQAAFDELGLRRLVLGFDHGRLAAGVA